MLTERNQRSRNPGKPFISSGTHEVQLISRTVHSPQEQLWAWGPQSPVSGSASTPRVRGGRAARGWIRGCGRVDTAWRPTAQAAIHPVGSGHSFCASAQHHTDVTLSHTHTRGSEHSF